MMEELAFQMASSSAHVPNTHPGHIREDKVVAGKGHEWFMVDSGKGVRKIRQQLKDKRETILVTVEHTNSYHPFLIQISFLSSGLCQWIQGDPEVTRRLTKR